MQGNWFLPEPQVIAFLKAVSSRVHWANCSPGHLHTLNALSAVDQSETHLWAKQFSIAITPSESAGQQILFFLCVAFPGVRELLPGTSVSMFYSAVSELTHAFRATSSVPKPLVPLNSDLSILRYSRGISLMGIDCTYSVEIRLPTKQTEKWILFLLSV